MELYFWCPEGYTRWLASSQAPQLYLYHLSLSSAGCAHAGLCTLRTEWALQSESAGATPLQTAICWSPEC